VLPLLGAPGGRGRGESLQGKGFHERLGVTPETLRMLEDRGVSAHVRQTREAIELYDEPRETEKVGLGREAKPPRRVKDKRA
jgi:hypothetical protein